MVATDSVGMSLNQVNSAHNVLRKYLKGKGRVFCRVYVGYSCTKKPIKTKMGGGKGKFYGYVAYIKRGKVLFEISGVDRVTALKVFKIAGSKLPCHYLVRDF